MIVEKQMSADQKKQEQALQEKGEKEFASKLAQSMDLPSTLTDAVDDHAKAPVEVKQTEEVEEQEEVVEEEGDETEDLTQEDAEEVADEIDAESDELPKLDDEEDLIPKSKVQKRIDELTNQIKRLKADQAKREEEVEQKKASDSELEQLEQMSHQELNNLKRQVRVEQIKAGTDETKLNRLLDLEDKIDRTIQSAPQRFVKNQTTRFNRAVEQSASEIEGFDKVKADIFNYAKTIYQSAPELQGSVEGQARAWQLASEHYKALRKASEGKSDTNELKRQVNTLKKKISIDSSSKKAVAQPDSLAKLKRKAVHGTDADKAAFIKKRMNTDALVSDDELRAFRGR